MLFTSALGQLLEADPVLESSLPRRRHPCSQKLRRTLWKRWVFCCARYLPFCFSYTWLKTFSTDAGWPDCFNSGVFVFKPNLNTYNDLVRIPNDFLSSPHLLQVELATSTGSFDGGDQGLLNTHFSSWATQVKTNCPFKCLLYVWYLGYFEAPSLRVQHGRLCLLLLPTRLQEVRRQREDRSLHRSRQAVDGRGRSAFTCVRVQEILVAALLLSGISISITS